MKSTTKWFIPTVCCTLTETQKAVLNRVHHSCRKANTLKFISKIRHETNAFLTLKTSLQWFVSNIKPGESYKCRNEIQRLFLWLRLCFNFTASLLITTRTSGTCTTGKVVAGCLDVNCKNQFGINNFSCCSTAFAQNVQSHLNIIIFCSLCECVKTPKKEIV